MDPQYGGIGNDVAGHPSLDRDRLDRLPVGAAVDRRGPGLVGGQGVEDRTEAMDRVATHPRASGVGSGTGQVDLDPQRSLATGLDQALGRLTQDGAVAGQQVRPLGPQLVEPVVLLGHLLPGVEHEAQVDRRVGHGPGQLEEDGQATLHVGRTDPPQGVAVDPGLGVAVGRNRVGVPGQDQPMVAAEIGPGHQIVADPGQLQMIEGRPSSRSR